MVWIPNNANVQHTLGGERVNITKEYADQGVKVAYNLVGSVSDWYQGLDSDYFSHLMEMLSVMFQSLLAWFSGPQATKLFVIWICVLFGVFIFTSLLGFGNAGIIGGRTAAERRSYAYDAFIQTGCTLAFLTSMAMLGYLPPVAFMTGVSMAMLGYLQPFAYMIGVLIASFTTIICLFAGVGKPPL